MTSSGSGTFNFRNAASLGASDDGRLNVDWIFWIFVAVVIVADVPDVALRSLQGRDPLKSEIRPKAIDAPRLYRRSS